MILAIDTATRWLGLALHDGTAVKAELGWHCLNNHTVELTPAIADLQQRMGISLADLAAIAVAIGPGSYTGLRIGLAVAKGLSMANQIPLIGVSTMDIIAAGFGPEAGELITVVEAGRTRVSTAVYHWQNDGWQMVELSRIDSWDELLERLEGPLTFAGEISPDAMQKIRTSGKLFQVATAVNSVRRAGHLAEIGWQRLRSGKVDDAALLVPAYQQEPAGA